jgi:hypothetical protein
MGYTKREAMAVLSINGLTVPGDFPADQFEAVFKKLGAYEGRPEYELIFGALNAIAYRFTARRHQECRCGGRNASGSSLDFRYVQLGIHE